MLVTFDLLVNSPNKHREEIVMQMLKPECLLKYNIEYHNRRVKSITQKETALTTD